MLYSNYLRDKSQNAIKLNEVEGVPCILTHSKGKDLKNYEIYGNSYQATRSGKNLLPYPYTDKEVTRNGITIFPQSDGSLQISGQLEDGKIVRFRLLYYNYPNSKRPSGIYPRCPKLVQQSKINYHHPSHQQAKKEK